MAENPTTVVCAPALSDDAGTEWRALLEPLGASGDGTVGANLGWDLDWEREQLRSADGREHLSVRVYGDEVLVGPRWVPGTDSGCAGCAELRSRLVIDHPLTDDLTRPTSRVAPRRPFLPELTRAALARLAHRPLGPGELYAVGARGTRTHRIPRHFACPLCAPEIPERPVGRPPEPLALRPRPAAADNPGRAAAGAGLVRPGALRSRLVDPRFGPVLAQQRELLAPFAMSMALQPDAVALGYARETTFAKADPIAILEVYERLSGFPHQAPLVEGVSYAELVSAEGGAEVAVRPAAFGEYTEEQAARPTARIERVTDDTPMDWAWGHDLADGRPRLVPAELAFFQYDYRYGRDQRAARRHGAAPRRHLYQESSSGCAVGSCLEEAALYSLLELAERDAFLISFHRALPLPEITHSSITDPVVRGLLATAASRGFRVHLLRATQDIDLPVVWAMAVNTRAPFPATFSAAGSGIDPVSAVRGALWEVVQMATERMTWERSEAEPMLADPWLVDEMDDHLRLYALPEMKERVTRVLGGPEMSLSEAFAGWPDRLEQVAGGDVRGALDYVRGRYADAGLDRIVLVDSTTRDHADIGLAAAKAVVPGIVPMCFGQAQQRVAGLPRLEAALAGTPSGDLPPPYDPHAFP